MLDSHCEFGANSLLKRFFIVDALKQGRRFSHWEPWDSELRKLPEADREAMPVLSISPPLGKRIGLRGKRRDVEIRGLVDAAQVAEVLELCENPEFMGIGRAGFRQLFDDHFDGVLANSQLGGIVQEPIVRCPNSLALQYAGIADRLVRAFSS